MVVLTLNLVVASSYPDGCIGQNNALPWSLPGDLAYFRKLTTREPSCVIMGKHTWESIGSKPLPRRMNIVISSTLTATNTEDVYFFNTLPDALSFLSTQHEELKIFIIGGARLYEEAANLSDAQVNIFHTEIYETYPQADVFWKIPSRFKVKHATPLEKVIDEKSGKDTWFRRFEWVHQEEEKTTALQPNAILRAPSNGLNPEEDQYLDLIYRILTTGNETNDRTNTGVYSLMGGYLKYDLRTGFPLITSKKMFWRGIVQELLWLLMGDTDAKNLSAKGVNIWNKDTSREILDARGMQHLEEGDCGATYGFNLRHYGAEYKGCRENYKGQGVDQLAKCIETLKTDPYNRRIILNLYNPATLNNCSLPPCLMTYCMYVANGELSCFTLMRSADCAIGILFNIASASLLLHILANICGLKVGDLHHNIVNAHVYKTHVEGAKEQLQRNVWPKCALEMPQIQDETGRFVTRKLTLDDIDNKRLSWKDFKLIGYRSEPPLTHKLEMAA